jgi:hypothetical protein
MHNFDEVTRYPLRRKALRMKDHSILSKAFAKSIFNIRACWLKDLRLKECTFS